MGWVCFQTFTKSGAAMGCYRETGFQTVCCCQWEEGKESVSWRHAFLELSEDGKCGCHRASTPWEGTAAFSSRATCPLSVKYFPALLFLDSNNMGVLCSLLASMTAIESVIYLCTWQCWVGNELRASCMLGKDATSSCHICDCYTRRSNG